MKLYIMRHGRTVWNEKGICQGRSQNRLSKNGKAQTQEVAQKLKEVKFDYIFSSPLFRTIQTANIINSYHHSPIIKNNLLIEIDQGIFTGKRIKTLTDEQLLEKQNNSMDCGMETKASVFERAEKFFRFLMENYSNKCVLVITHGCIATSLSCLASGNDLNDLQSFDYKNAEVKYYELEKK